MNWIDPELNSFSENITFFFFTHTEAVWEDYFIGPLSHNKFTSFG